MWRPSGASFVGRDSPQLFRDKTTDLGDIPWRSQVGAGRCAKFGVGRSCEMDGHHSKLLDATAHSISDDSKEGSDQLF